MSELWIKYAFGLDDRTHCFDIFDTLHLLYKLRSTKSFYISIRV